MIKQIRSFGGMEASLVNPRIRVNGQECLLLLEGNSGQ